MAAEDYDLHNVFDRSVGLWKESVWEPLVAGTFAVGDYDMSNVFDQSVGRADLPGAARGGDPRSEDYDMSKSFYQTVGRSARFPQDFQCRGVRVTMSGCDAHSRLGALLRR